MKITVSNNLFKNFKTIIMKKILLLSLLLIVSLQLLKAQKGPLNGSGKIISKTFDEKDFDKIELKDLAGKAEIEVGKQFSISINIDDNLEKLLSVKANNGKLKIEFEGNENNKMYVENTNVSVRISLPEISVLEHRGNNQLVVNGIIGRYFRLEKTGNGDVQLNGSIDNLDIKKSGNGNVNATNVLAQEAEVNSSGNGDVTVNAVKVFRANGSGNGDIKNTGAALANTESSKSGNGDIVDPSYKPKMNPYPGHGNDEKVKTRIQNNTNKSVELKVVYPVRGNYGIDIMPGATRREFFPLGTKIYRQGKMKEPLFEITPENRDSVLVIE
jgi:hypothetical protein